MAADSVTAAGPLVQSHWSVPALVLKLDSTCTVQCILVC